MQISILGESRDQAARMSALKALFLVPVGLFLKASYVGCRQAALFIAFFPSILKVQMLLV